MSDAAVDRSCSLTSVDRPSRECRNIDDLSDDILRHILSFLRTKEAVATSTLSKRWHNLWILVPVLDFNDYLKVGSFIHLVNGGLINNKVTLLDKFRLHYGGYIPECFTDWINGVLDGVLGRVRDLDISIPHLRHHNFEFPVNVFTVENLQVLKLSYVFVNIPSGMLVCLPSLKILHLKKLCFANDESVSRLLRGCLVLEELLVMKYRDVRNLVIFVPTLKTLNVASNCSAYFGSHCEQLSININAPNLEYLRIDDDKRLVHLESVPSSLIKANIAFNGAGLFQLTKALCHAKFLCLRIKGEFSDLNMNGNSFPLFLNLTKLVLLGRKCDMTGVLIFFLKKSPKLEVLRINMVPDSGWQLGHARVKRRDLPKRLSPYLKKFSMINYRGNKVEIKMAEYIVKNAPALELIEIRSCRRLDSLKFPRLSNNCQLEFIGLDWNLVSSEATLVEAEHNAHVRIQNSVKL
ncbi:hypothetical protein COLO4_09419 [Corchorus olitorius]|uniref:FBD domain-containing protein n=1 Tax=Corchorus olitorius TaxID=93759 RepID=A0A1R3KC96_9ROSI|nr:hypothetical protein COLO4_09419 [Corchorus olitorius]